MIDNIKLVLLVIKLTKLVINPTSKLSLVRYSREGKWV